MIKKSISNIAWKKEQDSTIFILMNELNYSGLEIAPTRVFGDYPYEHIQEANSWMKDLRSCNRIRVSSMQSIWFGRKERIFGSEAERRNLLEYTKKAILFAEAIQCNNLVFGCPRNRCINDERDLETALVFFREIGDFAERHHTVVALEANPTIYHTNFLNTTSEAVDFVNHVDSKGLRLNLDLGTMIENDEEVSDLIGVGYLINHVHISEPGLNTIKRRSLHKELADYLKSIDYDGYVSIEVGMQDDVSLIEAMMNYVSEIME